MFCLTHIHGTDIALSETELLWSSITICSGKNSISCFGRGKLPAGINVNEHKCLGRFFPDQSFPV